MKANFRYFCKYCSASILGMLGLSCYVFADTFFVANCLGAKGLTALNLALPPFGLMTGLGLMLGVGGATRYTILRAQGDEERASMIFILTLIMGAFFALVLFLVGLLAAEPVAILFGARDEVVADTTLYLRTILLMAPFFIISNILSPFVRNDGAPRLAMMGMLIGSCTNIILDYLFMYPFKMGIFGAAFATGLSQLVLALVVAGHIFFRRNSFHIRRIRGIRLSSLTNICAPGLTSLVGELSTSIVILVLNLIILSLAGNTGVAAYGVIANVAYVAIALFTGLAQGSQPLFSHCYGSADYPGQRRILRYALVTAGILGLALTVCAALFASQIVAVFNSEDNLQLALIAEEGLKIYFTGMVFAGINIVLIFCLSAIDASHLAFSLSLCRAFIFLVGYALLFSRFFALDGVWLTFVAAELTTLAICLVLCRRHLFRRGDDLLDISVEESL